MPHYLFAVRKGAQPPDSTDVELDGIADARAEAAMLIGQEMKDHPHEFWSDEEWQCEVADAHGLVLFTVFSSAIHAAASSTQR